MNAGGIVPAVSDVELGERLRIARDTAGLTQEAVASATGIGRTTLLAVERGQRRVRTIELQALAQLYRTSANALLRREGVFVDLVPRFRALSSVADVGADGAAHLLSDLVRAEVELENILGVSRQFAYPPERPIQNGDVRVQAENDAQALRQWLGVGEAPIQDIFALIEFQIGIRVYSRPLAAGVSGLFAFDERVGACMLINSLHRRDRRSQTAAHELGHFMGTRYRPEVYRDEQGTNSREERYAQAFGRALLTPAKTLMVRFSEVTAGASHLTRRHIILLAHEFGVSRQALVRRLEELDLAKLGTWDWFQDNGEITDEQARQVLGDVVELLDASRSSRSSRLFLLAIAAWKQDLLSEGQMTELLRLSRLEVRELMQEAGSEEEQVDDLFKLPR